MHRAIWGGCGAGKGGYTAQPTRGPPCPGSVRAGLPRTARQPPLQLLAAGCSCRGRESAILKRAFLFRCLPAGCLPHTVLPGAGERAAGRGLDRVLGLLAPCPLGCLPLRADALERIGGRGREDVEGGLRRCPVPPSPPAPGVARDGDSLCFPLAPGKVPGRLVAQPFLGYCQMVKGGGVPRRAGGEGSAAIY